MVAALIEVGKGRLKTEDVASALAGRRPALDGAMAPARGLCLRRVAFGRRANAHTMETNEDR
jgi:tRNA U38,U39,U40 pseudouridine synthase TruA